MKKAMIQRTFLMALALTIVVGGSTSLTSGGRAAYSQTKTKVPISRTFMGFTIGEKLAEVRSKHKLDVMPEAGSVPGETKYMLLQPRENVRAITLRFLDGILYHFFVFFTEEYSEKVGWEGFGASAKKKYGDPLFILRGTPFWDDGKTILQMGKQRGRGIIWVSYSDFSLMQEVKRRKESLAPKF